nr:10026_t:CDS:2 [Entrophospora candida]
MNSYYLSESHYTYNPNVDVVGEIMSLLNLSLDELVNSLNELTFKTKENFDKVAKQNQEYEEKIKELEAEALEFAQDELASLEEENAKINGTISIDDTFISPVGDLFRTSQYLCTAGEQMLEL